MLDFKFLQCTILSWQTQGVTIVGDPKTKNLSSKSIALDHVNADNKVWINWKYHLSANWLITMQG